MSNLITVKLSQLDLPEAFVNYLSFDSNYDLLAAYAYDQYLRKGRGLLWLDWLNWLKSRPTEACLIYATPNNAAGRAFLQDADAKVSQLIRTYAPESQFLIRWQDETKRVRTRLLGGSDQSSSPSACYEHMKGRLSEFSLTLPLPDPPTP